jgi:DNA polymerase-3 subunit beta
MPILGHVLLEAKDDTVWLTTTNLDTGIRCALKASVQQPGAITLPARKLFTIFKSLPVLDVGVECTEQVTQVKITSGGSTFKIMGLVAADFPALPSIDKSQGLVLLQEELSQMLQAVAYAQSGDEARYILNGVYFAFKPGEMTLVATDGRRLALISKPISGDYSGLSGIILPAKTVAELLRLLGQGKQMTVYVSDRQIAFDIQVATKEDTSGLVGSIDLVSKVVEGKYPDYNQVIPKQTEYRVNLERELFQECVQRAALVANEKNLFVKLNFRPNNLEISASSPEYGESYESMALAYEGPAVQLIFKPQYLLEPLKALPDDSIAFEFKDELSPGVLKTLNHFLCVIMPIRMSQ